MPPSPKNSTLKQDVGIEGHKQTPRNSKQILTFFVFVITAILLSFGYFSGGIRLSTAPIAPEWIHAVTVLRGDSDVNGTIHFTQSIPFGVVKITGEVHGLDKNSLRGFHIQSVGFPPPPLTNVSYYPFVTSVSLSEYGDLSSGCASTGSHFNPGSATHGSPEDTIRHVGDLGNIKSDKHGVATLDFEDSVVSLSGVWSIIGRGVVVHTGTDDLGRGDNDDSKKTGNAGGRAACGVIGLAPTSD